MDEDMLVLAAQPYIEKLCMRKWKNIEYDDRVSEANLCFLLCLRSYPLETGRFLDDFEEILTKYMDEKNRRLWADRQVLSLDEPHAVQDGGSWTGYDICPAKSAETEPYVRLFLDALSPEESGILSDLMNGESRASVSRERNLTAGELKALLTALGERYQNGKW